MITNGHLGVGEVAGASCIKLSPEPTLENASTLRAVVMDPRPCSFGAPIPSAAAARPSPCGGGVIMRALESENRLFDGI